MLDTDTKRRIDTARDILVGKVPDPKSQVEQITIALIYKFMDDMDAEAEELGGERQFFTGEFAQYSWTNLMSPGVSGHDLLNLYEKGINTMPQNTGIPALFRDIFKNAYLPYRDPETLKSFLKIINEFYYDHSEKLGDAFEYLLSVLGSQGDAGQFRTPRHIIDFMVEVMQPKKSDVILDPACGTAGFLISAYKYILKTNRDSDNFSTLTPDDKGGLAESFKGYDISPDMVRLSLVNLYLHGFSDPHIFEYDTLTSEDRWNEFADLILANPPFMSPKGGIKPHKRFSIKAKRSEVLFVDYIAEHLKPNGRAAIIVPEGIIFQSQTAYKDLRKALVKDSLVAVVSLPAGVFNPYSGVKTSILILNKALAKLSDTVAFFKVENDGFGLGAQRRAIAGDNLPGVLAGIRNYELAITKGDDLFSKEFVGNNPQVLVVPRAKIGANGDFNLSGERYREGIIQNNNFPLVQLADVLKLSSGRGLTQVNMKEGIYPVYGGNGKVGTHSEYFLEDQNIVIGRVGAYCGSINITEPKAWITDNALYVTEYKQKIDQNYLAQALTQLNLNQFAKVGGQPSISQTTVYECKIPFPPIAVQKEIVAEIEGYQKVIDGAKAVIDNYRPHIAIDPDWAIIRLGEICSFKNGLNFTKSESGYTLKIIGVSDFQSNLYAPLNNLSAINLDSPLSEDYLVRSGDILFVRSNGNIDLVGRSMIISNPQEPTTFSGFTIRGRIEDDRALSIFFAHFFKSRDFAEMIKKVGQGANIRNLSQGILNELKIPLPPLETQKNIVAEIEAEQKLVNANRELITRFEQKIQNTLNRIWGEENKP